MVDHHQLGIALQGNGLCWGQPQQAVKGMVPNGFQNSQRPRSAGQVHRPGQTTHAVLLHSVFQALFGIAHHHTFEPGAHE